MAAAEAPPQPPAPKRPRHVASGGLSLAALAGALADGGGDVARRLRAEGMTASVAKEKQAMFAQAAAQLLEEGYVGEQSAKAFWVPGRVEIAGKHTDYCGGRSLLAATSKGFAVVSVDRDDNVCRIFTTFGRQREKSSALLQMSKDLEPRQGHWSAYPATAIRRLARNFDIQQGVDVALECDLEESSGMSTSSAVICYMWMALAERNGIQKLPRFMDNLQYPEELYSYLGCIENGQNCGSVLVGDKGVGTFGGSEDHTAIMSSEPGKVKMFSYCPTWHEGTFDFPPDWTFVISVSGAIAEKTGNAMADYNNAAFLGQDSAAAWCKSTESRPLGGKTFVNEQPNLAEIVRHVRSELAVSSGDISGDARVRAVVGEAIGKLDDGATLGPQHGDASVRYAKGALRERFEQFFDESEVMVLRIARAFADADVEALGRWSDESHRQTVEKLRNTTPETAWLPQEARRLGALGASAFGAGFGGSCWAVVQKRGAEAFAASWSNAYRKQFPGCAGSSGFFIMDPGPGAFSLHREEGGP